MSCGISCLEYCVHILAIMSPLLFFLLFSCSPLLKARGLTLVISWSDFGNYSFASLGHAKCLTQGLRTPSTNHLLILLRGPIDTVDGQNPALPIIRNIP